MKCSVIAFGGESKRFGAAANLESEYADDQHYVSIVSGSAALFEYDLIRLPN